jgi:2-polyprenyl-3-methyl-5-hydroxy-6-metoxy-1,4-benzoquinol methylase
MTDAYVGWKHWKPEDFGRFSENERTYFDWHLKRACAQSPARLRILEIGFGNGSFMGWARQLGHDVSGVELSEELVQRARLAGFDAATDLREFPETTAFDLIVGFDVIEHIDLENLKSWLQTLASRLAPEGRMMFRFPNAESPLGAVYQNGDITHVTRLGVSSMRQICGLTGLELICSGNTLPWRAMPLKKRPRQLVAHLVRRFIEWILARNLYGHWVNVAPNELVVLCRPVSAA